MAAVSLMAPKVQLVKRTRTKAMILCKTGFLSAYIILCNCSRWEELRFIPTKNNSICLLIMDHFCPKLSPQVFSSDHNYWRYVHCPAGHSRPSDVLGSWNDYLRFQKTLFAPCGPPWYVFLYEKNTLYIIPIQGEKLLLHLDVHQRWASIKT